MNLEIYMTGCKRHCPGDYYMCRCHSGDCDKVNDHVYKDKDTGEIVYKDSVWDEKKKKWIHKP